MASIIGAGTTAGTSLNLSGDTTGVLQFATNGTTTAMTIDTSQNVGIGTASPGSFGKFAVAGQSSLGVDQTDYVNVLGGGGTARVETVGGNTNINLALSTKGTGAFYIWRGGYGGTNTLLIDSSSNLQFNSGYGSVATAYGCRAWVNFDGTTASPSTRRGSGNVSSVTKNGTGDYTVNFTNAMPDTNYAVSGAARYGDNTTAGVMRVVSIASVGTLASAMSTTSVRVSTQYVNAGAEDQQVVCVAVFR